jgi:hypothetical protein
MYQHSKLIVVIGCLVMALFLMGCGKGKPKDIPALHSATVTVKNGSSPISDARVVLVLSGNSTGSWSVAGSTDANGVAKLATSQGDWKGVGAPAGEYTVFINKAVQFTQESLPEELEGDERAKQAFFAEQQKKIEALPKIIPTSLTNAITSPLKITVAAGSPSELTVDVSEHK